MQWNLAFLDRPVIIHAGAATLDLHRVRVRVRKLVGNNAVPQLRAACDVFLAFLFVNLYLFDIRVRACRVDVTLASATSTVFVALDGVSPREHLTATRALKRGFVVELEVTLEIVVPVEGGRTRGAAVWPVDEGVHPLMCSQGV